MPKSSCEKAREEPSTEHKPLNSECSFSVFVSCAPFQDGTVTSHPMSSSSMRSRVLQGIGAPKTPLLRGQERPNHIHKIQDSDRSTYGAHRSRGLGESRRRGPTTIEPPSHSSLLLQFSQPKVLRRIDAAGHTGPKPRQVRHAFKHEHHDTPHVAPCQEHAAPCPLRCFLMVVLLRNFGRARYSAEDRELLLGNWCSTALSCP